MHQPTILVIEDTSDHRDMLQRLFTSAGYRVVTAENHMLGLAHAQLLRPDLVLLSITHPNDPDWQLAHRIGDQFANSQTPVLGATVYVPLVTYNRARDIGCIDYIEKPFDIDVLLDRVQTFLNAA